MFKKKNSFSRRVFSLFTVIVFVFSLFSADIVMLNSRAQAASINELPGPKEFVSLSEEYSFPVLRGLRLDVQNPLEIEFIVDTGNESHVSQQQANALIRYFLAALTIPEKEVWVNLSPYQKNKVVPTNLGVTDMGKDLLSQDYLLKQLVSSLTYPETEQGKDFWKKTYKKVAEVAGTTNIPINTFNRVWIVPQKAEVYERGGVALVTEASLQAMLEDDYIALKNDISYAKAERNGMDKNVVKQVNEVSSGVMKQTILPKVTEEINKGKNFSTLRQIYHSLILGIWFKKKFKNSLYSHYINKGKVTGIDLKDPDVKEKIYNRYIQAVKEGLYDYVKKDTDPATNHQIKRRYYSGGFSLVNPQLGAGSGGTGIGSPSEAWLNVKNELSRDVFDIFKGFADRIKIRLKNSSGPNTGIAEASENDVEQFSSSSIVEVSKTNGEKAINKIKYAVKDFWWRTTKGREHPFYSYKKIPDNLDQAFEGQAMILPPFSTLAKDTSVSGDDANRRGALDLVHKGAANVIEVPQGRKKDMERLNYEYMIVPLVIEKGNIPEGLETALDSLNKQDEKNVTNEVKNYLEGYFGERVGITVIREDEDLRSFQLDPQEKGDVSIDLPHTIALKTESGDLVVDTLFWVKRNSEAIERLGEYVKKSSARKFKMSKPRSYDEIPDIENSQDAVSYLSKHAWCFWDDFAQGDYDRAQVLAHAINNIDMNDLVNPEKNKITYDKDLGVFVSEDGSKALSEFLSGLNSLQQLSQLFYLLAVPQFNNNTGEYAVVPNKYLQDSIIGFYAFAYSKLLNLGVEQFGDAEFFEPLRAEIGYFANKLNQALRNENAMEVNGTPPGRIAAHLEKVYINSDISLNSLEFIESDIRRIYNEYKKEGGVWAYDILQLAEIMPMSDFIASFRHLKVEDSRDLTAEDRALEGYDGSGRIATLGLALRFAADINSRDNNYHGRYAVRSTSIKGETVEDKLQSALSKAKGMFSDEVIKASGLKLKTSPEGREAPMSELIERGDLQLRAGMDVISAKQDFVVNNPVECVYPVRVVLNGEQVASIYFIDVSEFKTGIQELGIEQDNISRPAIVSEKGEDHHFGLFVDATPGGVHMGDGVIEGVTNEKGKRIVDAPTVFETAATNKLESASEKLGDVDEEMARLKEILAQVESRLGGHSREATYLKAQITKKLLPPLGGGIHFMGRYIHKLPKVKRAGASYLTPTSCSTNGASYVTLMLSTLFGFGTQDISILGTTAHMYTGGDKKKGVYADLYPKSTGAAKGVKQHLPVKGLFTAVRTPTILEDDDTKIVGGSIFDLKVQLPYSVPQSTLIKYLERVGAEFPEVLRVFNPQDKKQGRYLWQDTIEGQLTGSILYTDFIEQIGSDTFRIADGYDNEMSYSFKMNELKEARFKSAKRQADIERRQKVLSSSSGVPASVKTLDDVFQGKDIDTAILAADLNVARDKKDPSVITNDARIQETISTIKKLFFNSDINYVFCLTHSGRPVGNGYEEKYSLKPISQRLGDLLSQEGLDVSVIQLPYRNLASLSEVVNDIKRREGSDTKILFMLENIRFYSEEKESDSNTRKMFEENILSLTGETANDVYYVNEAFSKIHRGKEASMELVNMIPEQNRAAGVNLASEIEKLLAFENSAEGRTLAIFGGAKFDKWKAIGKLASQIKENNGTLAVVGALAHPFLEKNGKNLGMSLRPKEKDLQAVEKGIQAVSESAVNVLAPSDFTVAGVTGNTHYFSSVHESDKIVDVGPNTLDSIKQEIQNLIDEGQGTIVLNGGAGVFEEEKYRRGTREIILKAEEAAEKGITVIAVGGDMDTAISIVEKEMGRKISDKIIRTTGGGSVLEALNTGAKNMDSVSALLGNKQQYVSSSAVSIPALAYGEQQTLEKTVKERLSDLFETYGDSITEVLGDINKHSDLDALTSLEGTSGFDKVIRTEKNPDRPNSDIVSPIEIEAVKKSFARGEWALLVPAGGDATRLGLSMPKILLNLKELLSPANRNKLEASIEKAKSKDEIKAEQIESIEKLKDRRDDLRNVSILERILEQKTKSGFPVKIILACSEGDQQEIADELRNNDYFGIGRENFVIQPQAKNRSLVLKDGSLTFTDEVKRAGGNGVPIIDILLRGKGYRISESGMIQPLETSAIEYVEERGAKYLSQSTIGDLRAWGQDSWNFKFLAKVYDGFSSGEFAAAGEFVKQDKENIQKGGTVLYNKETQELRFVEKLAMSQEFLEQLNFENQPLATFNHALKIDAFKSVKSAEIPMYLRKGDTNSKGRQTFFTELVGGDVMLTALQNHGYDIAAVERPINISELKGTSTLPKTIEAALKQDFSSSAVGSSSSMHAYGYSNPGGIDFGEIGIESNPRSQAVSMQIPFDVEDFNGFDFEIISIEEINNLDSVLTPSGKEGSDKQFSYLAN